ncbi:MAG TPA: heparan-alpha-glucosaminide N-acetyltransferase domain-containing protein [Candidatus Sericytochromatia bacterium]
MSCQQQKLPKRLTSLDVFRGITITGMILVNMAGVSDQVYPPLLHADWNGCTPTDLVFPFFLFIIGVAIAFSFSKYKENKLTLGLGHTLPLGRILRRSAILFALGLLLNGFWNYNWSTIRIMGVLQRISLAYLLATLVILKLPRKGQWAIALLLLLGYWLAMSFIPVPGYGVGNLSRDGNLGAYLDRLIIGTAHLYKGDNFNSMGDPEGLFSTLPAVVSVLLGCFTGDWLRKQPVNSRTSMDLVLVGLSGLVIGEVWGFWFPINKKLWTSSYVVFTAGWALLLLAACYELIEVRGLRRWGKPFEIMGLNAIFAFVASVLMIKILVKTHIGTGEKAPTTYTWIYEHVFVPWAGAMNGSLFFAMVTVLFWWVVLYGMYRQRWFVKI